MRGNSLVNLQFALLALLALGACSGGSQPPPQPAAAQPPSPTGAAAGNDEPANPAFIGRIWRSSSPGNPLGTIVVFLPDRTMLMDSCFETYRIAQWKRLDDRRIEWTEDAARIEAEIVEVGESALRLRLHLGGEVQEVAYRLADVPMVCPDMPR